ncbi:hypothetical protein NDU88_005830 [Pleurodeles waltl]|uniref:Uncharacterized protein n=1 Tax=Pleurodeles waltl TaxID=8319 RepID=A0AAV7NTD4_PLEWA|nr:hypothetical protein NDU88_005830 [Pleurodeles waltl]
MILCNLAHLALQGPKKNPGALPKGTHTQGLKSNTLGPHREGLRQPTGSDIHTQDQRGLSCCSWLAFWRAADWSMHQGVGRSPQWRLVVGAEIRVKDASLPGEHTEAVRLGRAPRPGGGPLADWSRPEQPRDEGREQGVEAVTEGAQARRSMQWTILGPWMHGFGFAAGFGRIEGAGPISVASRAGLVADPNWVRRSERGNPPPIET